MKIAIGNDHAGTTYKYNIIEVLEHKKVEVHNFGTNTEDSVDYPDFVHPVATAVSNEKVDFGILLCGTANGVAITANKYKKIRAGICWNVDIVKLIRQHNNANILCIPSRFVSVEDALLMVDVFIQTEFDGGRHQNRINKINLSKF
ncbi:MAG: ribose 5-phosphate isomerase B [Flavobacteriaceae bacterium]|jgi:ribose 5-phosphate isomerase B